MKPHVANREREIELAALRCDEEGFLLEPATKRR
ncbi:hypothetical protein PI124_g5277 [Phytophthora idaei]|nr:hypothetical protein PI124_g5277 [Phytophthora idaei]